MCIIDKVRKHLKMDIVSKKPKTACIHEGEQRINGSITTPIFQSSTFINTQATSYYTMKYARMSNTPNHIELCKKIAALEHAESALVLSSGMGAISTALLGLLKSGDHIIAHKSLYGGTYYLLRDSLPHWGITTTFTDLNDPNSLAASLKNETRAVYLETLTNPNLEFLAIEEVVEFCKKYGLTSFIDNTIATPYNFQPLNFGIDVSLHSLTKYLAGHSDLVAGAVIANREIIEKLHKTHCHLGTYLDVNSCFLTNRGLKTFQYRMEVHNKNGLEVAQFLSEHPKVELVNYTGLKSHPNHIKASKLMKGHSGVISFVPRTNLAGALKIIKNLKYFALGPSIGGVESLACIPAQLNNKGIKGSEAVNSGLISQLIRISIGLEDVSDLIEDLDNALTGSSV